MAVYTFKGTVYIVLTDSLSVKLYCKYIIYLRQTYYIICTANILYIDCKHVICTANILYALQKYYLYCNYIYYIFTVNNTKSNIILTSRLDRESNKKLHFLILRSFIRLIFSTLGTPLYNIVSLKLGLSSLKSVFKNIKNSLRIQTKICWKLLPN